ncbi:rhodanese-like domain-containing protein [Desulfobacula sp.]|uniref:rhodanese-like domain-containing protein n=1 Tax=Desulfobacula sp. TaxID=2593537 RepID=UPI00261308DD|nr:rhodanese-like domain-containing protein [Desulfobacula sp.]
MIDTFFGLGQLDSSRALFMSLVIGILFGIVLERAGFGSSRRLSGVFYFRDMAVIKVMFTGMITAIIGITLSVRFGLISEPSIYLMPTLYKAQIIGGLLFGIGFVTGGWCPGTAAVGAASGKWDAVVFLGGAIGGSIFFNETYAWIKGVYEAGNPHIAFIYQSIGMPKGWFILFFVLTGILVFWCVELIEKKRNQTHNYLHSDFLKQFSFVLLVAGFSVFMFLGDPSSDAKTTGSPSQSVDTSEQVLLTQIENALDHMDPEDLARRLMAGPQDLVLVDVRSEPEFLKFHIKTARHIPLKDLVQQLEPYRNKGLIVLYSNGMTHPAQARDVLARLGFGNVYLLTDGLDGFIKRCLRPVSLRSEPVPESAAREINQWRQFFLTSASAPAGKAFLAGAAPSGLPLPGIIDSQRLSSLLGIPDLRVIDLRSQPEYNTRHIPGSLALNVESLRGNIKGIPSCLLPAPLLAGHLSLMGIQPRTLVVMVCGDKVQDATLAGMALERLGHANYAVLAGGFLRWKAMGLPTDTLLPQIKITPYPEADNDQFTIDYKTVLSHMQNKTALIIDVRPQAYYTGEKSDEARAGHIPGAVNRPFDLDTVKSADAVEFKPVSELTGAYEKIIPSKATHVIVHCRTGHQASQTFFVLKHLLGYSRILWYDAGWTEWASRMELPVKTGITP